MATKMAQPRGELAILIDKPVEEICNIKVKNDMYDPIDGLMIISEKHRRHCADDLRSICEKYPDVSDKLGHVDFGGRGARPGGLGHEI